MVSSVVRGDSLNTDHTILCCYQFKFTTDITMYVVLSMYDSEFQKNLYTNEQMKVET